MDYKKEVVEKIKEEIDSNELTAKCRINEKDFIRNRKVTPKDIILYEFNKRGLSTKMEIINFNNINNVQEISSPGLFKQREKLNPEVFVYLQQIALKNFYIDCSIKNMNQKIDDMISLGYTKKELMKMIKNTPAIFGYSTENIQKK